MTMQSSPGMHVHAAVLAVLAGATVVAAGTGNVSCLPQEEHALVNLRHLDHLTEVVSLSGREVSIVHIYANYPDYTWVDAEESGPEGIACVDDAARAAVLCLRDFELNGQTRSLDRARGYLEFVLAMQAEDGQFYNFILGDHTINRDGQTSVKSFGWWAARGLWCLAHGYRVFRDRDAALAERLDAAVRRALPHVHALVKRYGSEEVEGGFRVPQWLLYRSAADATSELLLGLAEYYRAKPSEELAEVMRKLADGLMVMQDGHAGEFPYGLHRSWRTLWHMWGNGQTQALATVGHLLGDSTMVHSAKREADGWYVRLLCEGFLKEMDVRNPGSRKHYEQIAYGARPVAVGCVRLYEATGKREYLRFAGLAASWLLGNNEAGIALYDSITGRCYDGLNSPSAPNRNSGAESTIEALLALVELGRYPEALPYLRFRRVSSHATPSGLHAVFENRDGRRLTLRLEPAKEPVLSEDSGGGQPHDD